jgi:hypothetical protein
MSGGGALLQGNPEAVRLAALAEQIALREAGTVRTLTPEAIWKLP